MAQQTINISTPNDNLGDPVRTAFLKCNQNFDELYAGTGTPESGEFNVVSYGADPTGVNDSASAINDAITAASAYAAASTGLGATVIIPSGRFYITEPIILKSYVHIKCAHNTKIYVPNGYAEQIYFHDGNSILTRCKVSGGYYSQTGLGNDYIGVELRSTAFDKYITWVEFEDMYFYYPDKGFYFNITNNGWCNGNIFRNVVIWRPVIGVDFVKDAAAYLTGNLFDSIQVQTYTMTTYGFHDVKTYRSLFVNCRVWDVSLPCIAFEFVGGSYHNTIINGSPGYLGTTLLMGGTGNMAFGIDEYMIALPYAGQIDFYNGQCSIVHTGSVLTVTAPYGFGAASGSPMFYTPRNTGNVTAGTGITTTMHNRLIVYNGSSAVNISANPQIAAGYKDGTVITIIGSSDVNTLTLEDGDGLALAGGAAMVLGANDTITLAYISALSLWVELSRSNN